MVCRWIRATALVTATGLLVGAPHAWGAPSPVPDAVVQDANASGQQVNDDGNGGLHLHEYKIPLRSADSTVNLVLGVTVARNTQTGKAMLSVNTEGTTVRSAYRNPPGDGPERSEDWATDAAQLRMRLLDVQPAGSEANISGSLTDSIPANVPMHVTRGRSSSMNVGGGLFGRTPYGHASPARTSSVTTTTADWSVEHNTGDLEAGDTSWTTRLGEVPGANGGVGYPDQYNNSTPSPTSFGSPRPSQLTDGTVALDTAAEWEMEGLDALGGAIDQTSVLAVQVAVGRAKLTSMRRSFFSMHAQPSRLWGSEDTDQMSPGDDLVTYVAKLTVDWNAPAEDINISYLTPQGQPFGLVRADTPQRLMDASGVAPVIQAPVYDGDPIDWLAGLDLS